VIRLLWLAICSIEDKQARDRGKEAGLGRGAKRKAEGQLVEGQTTTNCKQALARLALIYSDRINLILDMGASLLDSGISGAAGVPALVGPLTCGGS
jgi:hypothetical protein